MNFRVIKLPDARSDADEIAAYIARDNFDAAIDFLESVEQTLADIAEYPYIGRPRPELRRIRGLRSYAVNGYRRYMVFYRPTKGTIEVVRILHGARDIGQILGD